MDSVRSADLSLESPASGAPPSVGWLAPDAATRGRTGAGPSLEPLQSATDRPPLASRPGAPGRTRRRFHGLLLASAAATMTVAAAGLAHRAVTTESAPGRATVLETSHGERQRWFADAVVVTIDPSLHVLGEESRRAIEEAFSSWHRTGARLPEVRFVEANAPAPSLHPDGVSSVLVAPIEFEGHQADLAITVGFSNPKTGEITEADIVINSRHVFSTTPALVHADLHAARPESCTNTIDAQACNQTYDLQNVLTHEVGHFWGLGEDYDDPSTTMYSCTSACELHKRELSTTDVDVVTSLYLATGPQGGGCGGAHVARHAGGNWLLAFLAFATLVLWRRRPQRGEAVPEARSNASPEFTARVPRHEVQRLAVVGWSSSPNPQRPP